MAQAISYSIFGYGREKHANSFSFQSYMVGLHLNIKMRDIVYKDWAINVSMDNPTRNGEYRKYWDKMEENGKIYIDVTPVEPLCMAMFRRMAPIFNARYDRVICRDTDSLLSAKERRCVEYWVKTGRVALAITDSTSHNVTFLGGLCGFQNKEFREMMRVNSFEELVALDTKNTIDWNVKGADQTFLAKIVLPRVHESLVEFYLLGMKQSFRGECYHEIPDIEISDMTPEMEVKTNDLIRHMGEAGFIIPPVLNFFEAHTDLHDAKFYDEIENEFKDVFYWKKWE